MSLTRYKVAKGINVPQRRIDEICSRSRGITADTALRLGRFFGMDAEVWMNLQVQYDLEIAGRDLHKRLDTEVMPLRTAA
jgi:addiction module HigA family antidote